MKQGLYCGVVKNLIFLGTAVWQEFLYYGMTSEGLAIHSWKKKRNLFEFFFSNDEFARLTMVYGKLLMCMSCWV